MKASWVDACGCRNPRDKGICTTPKLRPVVCVLCTVPYVQYTYTILEGVSSVRRVCMGGGLSCDGLCMVVFRDKPPAEDCIEGRDAKVRRGVVALTQRICPR